MTPMPDERSASETYRLVSGKYRAEIVSTGAGLRMLEFDGLPLTETFAAGKKPPLSAGNRMRIK